MYLYDGCRKEILYRSSDQYGCCCFICDRKQQDQAERKKYRYSDIITGRTNVTEYDCDKTQYSDGISG